MASFNKRLFLLVLTFVLSAGISARDTKHALLIGIGKYKASTGWKQLSSSNDIDLLTKALLKQNFAQKNIHLLLDEQVTKRSIVQAIENDLLKKIKKGDIVVFHYSGHGQQILDNNGDELDGLDEAIVPFDSPKKFQAGIYEGEKLIRDDKLESLFEKVRKKLGVNGHLLVSMDACHSGTALRGLKKARGTHQIMASEIDLESVKRLELEPRPFEFSTQLNKAAPMVCLFSSTARQLSYELTEENGKSYGIFSYALSKYLQELEVNTTYQGLLENIKSFIAGHTSLQQPQLEGTPELVVLNGEVLPKVNYFPIVDWINKSTVLLSSGKVQGLFAGTKMALYPLDTRDTSVVAPIAIGTIIYTEPFLAEIELDRPLTRMESLNTWALIVEKNYGLLKVSLQLDLPASTFSKTLTDLIQNTNSIKFVDDYPDIILKKNHDLFQLINKDGYLLYEERNPSAKDIYHHCMLSAQSQFLRTLAIEYLQYNAQVRLLKDEKEQDYFNVGDYFEIEIKNIGTEGFYFSLLDIQPDNIINILPLSENKRSIEEYFLKPGATFISQTMEIFEPTGTEIFKLITTSIPIDLTNILTNSALRGQNRTPLEVMLSGNFFTNDKRGTANKTARTAGVFSKIFFISNNK